MTTLTELKTNRDNLEREDSLKQRSINIQAQVTQWMADTTILHGSVVDADDKTQVVAMRDSMIAGLTAILIP